MLLIPRIKSGTLHRLQAGKYGLSILLWDSDHFIRIAKDTVIQSDSLRRHAASPAPLGCHGQEYLQHWPVFRIDLEKFRLFYDAKPLCRIGFRDAGGNQIIQGILAVILAAAGPKRSGIYQFFARAPILISPIAVLMARRIPTPSTLRAAVRKLSRVNSIGVLS